MIIEQDAVGRDGLFSLTSEDAAAVDRVDAAVLEWAAEQGATVERHPELFTVSQLARIDYFDSFPHLAHRVTPWLQEQHGNPDNPGSEELVLTSAACYGVYFSRAGAVVDDLDVVTVRQTCRRRENSYQLRRRQREFQMREVVALGMQRAVEAFLRDGMTAVRRIADRFSVAGEFGVATDPFFRKDDPRLLHQRLFPTKQEFVDTSGLAIASVNSHRNFFGERCEVRLADGTPMSTGCVAFGLERWADAVGRTGRPPEKLGEQA